MGNFAYGSGGNSINFGQGLDAITSLMQGFNGSPQQMNKNRQFDISEGHLGVDQGNLGVNQGNLGVAQAREAREKAKQNFTLGNAIALGDAFATGIKPRSNGWLGLDSVPLPEAARSGDLSSLAALIGAANEQPKVRLGLPTEQYARDLFIQSDGDPTKLALGDSAIDYGQSKALNQLGGELSLKNYYTKDLYGTSNVNAGLPQLIDAIVTGPGTPQEKAARLQAQKDYARSAGVSGGYSPEQKAAGEVYKDVLGFTTPVSPAEGNVAQRLTDMAVAAENAKAAFKSGTYDVNNKEGALGLRMNQAGLNARQQLDEPYDQQIRVDEAKSKLDNQGKLAEIVAKAKADRDIPNVSTPEGARQLNMSEAGYSAEKKLQQEVNDKIRLEEAKAKLGIEYPTTPTAYSFNSAEAAGIPKATRYADSLGTVSVPPGGNVMLAPGGTFEKALKPSDQVIKDAQEADAMIRSMTPEQVQALSPEQKASLVAKINAAKGPASQIPIEQTSGRFPTKQEAPKEGKLVYNPDTNSVFSVKLDKVPADVDSEFNKLTDALSEVNRAIAKVEKNRGAFGLLPGQSGVGYGVGTMVRTFTMSKGEIAARAAAFKAVAAEKHKIYGAALTGGEQLDANNFLPANTDDADAVLEKLGNLQTELHGIIERRMDAFHPFKGYHFLGSYEEARPMIDPASAKRAQTKNKAN